MMPAIRLSVLARLTAPALVFSLALFASPHSSSAQATPAASAAGLATLRGSVGDSIHRAALVGAIVHVEGTERTGTTGNDGTFRVDSIPPGARRITIMHPMLDTIGIPMRSGAIQFSAGETQTIEFAVPSGERLAALLCTAAWRERFGPAVVIGFVRDPDTNGPAVGAKVEVVYTGTDIIGRKMPPSSRSAVVDSTGLYHICGLPADMTGKVQVFRNGIASGEVPIAIEHNIAVRAFSVAGTQTVTMVKNDSGKVVRVATGSARLTGRITDKSGKPLENARVMLQGGATMAISKSNGEFVLDSLPSGTQAVVVRRLGYGVAEQAVELSANKPARTEVTMSEYVALAPVVVEAAKETGLQKVGYLDRKQTGMGQFMDGKAINHNAVVFSDVMRMARGLKVQPLGDGRTYVISDSRSTNGCLNFYLDGTPWTSMSPGDIDDVARPNELVAVEIYHGGETPPQFTKPGESSCAAVVIWTTARIRDDFTKAKKK